MTLLSLLILLLILYLIVITECIVTMPEVSEVYFGVISECEGIWLGIGKKGFGDENGVRVESGDESGYEGKL
jgi:hypothetical protein